MKFYERNERDPDYLMPGELIFELPVPDPPPPVYYVPVVHNLTAAALNDREPLEVLLDKRTFRLVIWPSTCYVEET